MRRPTLLLRCALSLLLPFAAAAGLRAAQAGPILIDGQPFFHELGPRVSTLFDPGGNLTIGDVTSPEWSARFEPSTRQIPSFGFTSAALWVRFTIASTSARDESVIVELGMSRMRHFEWFVVDRGAVEKSLACSIGDAADSWRSRSRYPVMAFILPAGETRTIYARARSDASMWFPLVLGSPTEFDNFASRRDFWDFSHVGFCAALALLSFGLWLAGARNRLYLSVALAMTFGLLQIIIFNGTYAWLGGPWVSWVSFQGLPVCVLLFAAAFARFGQDYLGWESLIRPERIALRTAYILCAAAAVAVAFIPYALSMALVLPLEVIALAVPAAVSASVALRRRGRGMFLYLLAWLLLMAGIILMILQFYGAMPVMVAPADVMRIILPSVFFIFMLSGATAQRQVLQMQAKVATLQQAETEARLAALRYQVNPHLLFNTLTSITELSHEAPARIPQLVGRLADFLRQRLRPEPSSDITLASELESVRAYLDIEQVRFEERLKVDYDITPEAGTCLVPDLMLMPLVENAVKYGFEDSEVLCIRIAARVRGGRLSLRVENNGRLRSDRGRAHGTGLGMENIRARLTLRYGTDANFGLRQEGELVAATLEIPAAKSAP